MKRHTIALGLLFSALSLITPSQAYFSDLNFGAGLMNESIGKFQTDVDGSKSKFNHSFMLEAETIYDLSEGLFLSSNAGLVFPSTEESYITKRIFFLNIHAGILLTPQLSFRAGTGLYMTNVSGDGGTVELPNGTGTTSFIIPEESSTARNITFNIAAAYQFNEQYSARLELITFNIADSDSRTLNYALTAHYHFGDSLWNDSTR